MSRVPTPANSRLLSATTQGPTLENAKNESQRRRETKNRWETSGDRLRFGATYSATEQQSFRTVAFERLQVTWQSSQLILEHWLKREHWIKSWSECQSRAQYDRFWSSRRDDWLLLLTITITISAGTIDI